MKKRVKKSTKIKFNILSFLKDGGKVKNVLFVVDERMMGGVSVLLTDMLNMIDLSCLNVDVLILHNRGEMLYDLPKKVNIIYGTKYFSAIDLSLKEVIESKNIFKILRKLQTILDLKTMHVKKRIIKERSKMKLKHYDYEIAFKDGYTAVFTAVGDSDVKYHWLQYDYALDNPNAKYPNLFKDLFQSFDKLIAVSEGVKKDFNNIYHMESKTIVINNLVDLNKIAKKAIEKREIALDKNVLNIISIGRILNKVKGYDRLVNIIYKLKNEGLFENAVLRIFGDGPDFAILQQQISNLDLEKEVILMGKVDNPYKFYKGNDLFILPSRFDAFGLVVVEALCLEVPVLATENGATKELIGKDYGVVVKNNDDALYEGLKKLLCDRDLLKRYKENLKGYHYNNDKIIQQINSLFK